MSDFHNALSVMSAEITRLRDALWAIAALQPTEPECPLTEDIGPRDVWADMDDAFEGASDYGARVGRYEAASLARAALAGRK